MSIFNAIRTTLETAIDAMTTPTFNFVYDNVNEYRPGSMTYPNVKVTFPEEIGREKEGEVINSYSTDVVVNFRVMVDATPSDPDEALEDVLEDFKRLMEDQHNDLQVQGMVQSDFIDSVKEFTNVRARPAFIDIKFNVFYRVQKTDPNLTT